MVSALCRGFWIFRGQDIPPIMKEECFDLDLYTWTKINPSDEVITPLAELKHRMQLHVPVNTLWSAAARRGKTLSSAGTRS